MTRLSNTNREIEALVVGGVDYGDSDRVVHLLTNRGRMAVFAHGAKKSRRRFFGALEPFTTVRALLKERPHRPGMSTLASTSVLASRIRLREDLGRIALASYIVELGAAVAPEGEAADTIYRLVTRALDGLLLSAASPALRRVFELHLMSGLGYRPRLDVCLVCEGAGGPERVHVDFSRGGVLCRVHRGNGPELALGTIQWMERLFDGTMDGDESGVVEDESPGDAASDAARGLGPALRSFYASLLGRPLKTSRLLDELQI